MTSTKDSKSAVVATAKQLSVGAAKHLSNATPVTFAGGPFTADQIVSKLQARIDLRSAVDAAKATAKAKLAAETAQAPDLDAFARQLRAFAKASYRNSPDVLADFGITSKARVAPTVESKAAAVAKRAATRTARHTMGAKQKAGVKGDVTGVVVTPVTAPSPVVTAPSSPTAPATSVGPAAASSPASPATSGASAVAAATPHTA